MLKATKIANFSGLILEASSRSSSQRLPQQRRRLRDIEASIAFSKEDSLGRSGAGGLERTFPCTT